MRISQNYALPLIFVILVGYMIIHIFNGRFIMYDFQVYYRTAERLTEGQNLYRIAEDGIFVFKYSAVSAMYFIPLSWLPNQVAKIIYWLSSAAAFCMVLYLVYRIGENALGRLSIRKRNLLYFISFICAGAFFELEIHLGQVNVFILLLLLISTSASMKGRYNIAGILLAVSIFLKPFGLVLAALFIYRKKYRELLVFAGFCIILFFLPLLYYGSFEMLIEQNLLWFNELIIELGNEQDIMTPETHTVFSVIARYSPLRWIKWTPAGTLVFEALVLLVFGILFILLKRRVSHDRALEAYELALLFAMVPLTLYTGRNLYIFTVIMVAIVLIDFDRLSQLSKIFFITGILISSFNIIEIWGPAITERWEAMSLISVGTIIIWIVLYIKAFQGASISTGHP